MLNTIKNEKLTVSIDSHGAELKEIIGYDGTSYLWKGDNTYWKDSAPVLFPFVARLYNKSYVMDGKKYNLDIHGFAKNAEFSVKKESESDIFFTIKANDETLKQYPRYFTFTVHYYLTESTLCVEYIVENEDSKEMAFGIGGHPGINIPLNKDLKFEDYYLKFEKSNAQRIIFTPDCFVTGDEPDYTMIDNKINLQHNLFDDDAIVLKNSGSKVTIGSDKDDHFVTFDYSDYKYIGFWHAVKTDAPYVCVEPWATLPGKIELKDFDTAKDLIRLESGKTFRNKFTITLK